MTETSPTRCRAPRAESLSFTFSASLDMQVAEEGVQRLLLSGPLDDPDLSRRAERLERLFLSAIRTAPPPLWAPGLVIEREWRTVTETFLAWEEIAPSFRRLVSLALRYAPPTDPLASFPSWPEFLERCSDITDSPNPALFLRNLLTDDTLRRRWLFTLFLPRKHGNGFDRYPAQQEFLRTWLARRRSESGGAISCLDAACGSGEGTWELAAACRESGFTPHEVTIHGSSLDPLEIFAAAHAFIPHDRHRQREYRQRIAPLVAAGFGERLHFRVEDLADAPAPAAAYDLILCNGLLGGPLLHDRELLMQALAGMAGRLRPGGLLLAADRFHEGWRKRTPNTAREAMLVQNGMRIVSVGEGIGGVKQG